VVLPAPLGPISAWIVPRRTFRSTLSTATKPLNSFVRALVSRISSPLTGAPWALCAVPPSGRNPSSGGRAKGSCGLPRCRPRRAAADALGERTRHVERGLAMPSAAISAEQGLVDADGDRGGDAAGRIEHRCAERIHAFANAFVVDAVAAPSRQGQLLVQPLETARALLRQADAEVAGEAPRHFVGRQVREHRLAAAREVRRQ